MLIFADEGTIWTVVLSIKRHNFCLYQLLVSPTLHTYMELRFQHISCSFKQVELTMHYIPI